MTGYATAPGSGEGWAWSWEIRSVNGRGLDLRLRVPDWLPGLEPRLRALVQGRAARGSISIALRLAREGGDEGGLDRAAIEQALGRIRAVEAIAAAEGRELLPVRATDVLAMRSGPDALAAAESTALRDRVLAFFESEVLPAFAASREAEGRALDAILTQRLDEIGDLIGRARAAAEARRPDREAALSAALARVPGEIAVDPDRLAQELALIWVKQDVSEEIDRLETHVGAARALVAAEEPKGRRLDFLTQEFNREANTLCAKSQDGDLTALGLDLKSVIDQLREQVQNVE